VREFRRYARTDVQFVSRCDIGDAMTSTACAHRSVNPLGLSAEAVPRDFFFGWTPVGWYLACAILHAHALQLLAAAQVGDETTKTGAPKETFGTGTASQSEAGKKGAEISGAPLLRMHCALSLCPSVCPLMLVWSGESVLWSAAWCCF